MKPLEFMKFLRLQVEQWVSEDVQKYVEIECTVVAVKNITLAQIQRANYRDPDQTFYPTLGPYEPRVGDTVKALVVTGGLVILGAVNRGGNTDRSLHDYAKLVGGAVFIDSPKGPTADYRDNDNKLATTAHIKDVLFMRRGTATVNSGTGAVVVVTFPTHYDTPPIVVATFASITGVSSASAPTIVITASTTTTFSIAIYTKDGSTAGFVVNWIATA